MNGDQIEAEEQERKMFPTRKAYNEHVAKHGKVVIKPGYYLAVCPECSWYGCSSKCGTDFCGGDDTDVYCPKCHAAGGDV